MTRRTVKEAVAEITNNDIADIQEYQPGRWFPAIFDTGWGFVTVLKTNDKGFPKHRDDRSTFGDVQAWRRVSESRCPAWMAERGWRAYEME